LVLSKACAHERLESRSGDPHAFFREHVGDGIQAVAPLL
jgi:hypothetical protein